MLSQHFSTCQLGYIRTLANDKSVQAAKKQQPLMLRIEHFHNYNLLTIGSLIFVFVALQLIWIVLHGGNELLPAQHHAVAGRLQLHWHQLQEYKKAAGCTKQYI